MSDPIAELEEAEEEIVREALAEELAERGWNRQAEKVRNGEIPVDDYDVTVE